METLSSSVAEHWHTGTATFFSLRARNNWTTKELAFSLGIPMAQYVVAVRHAWEWWHVQDMTRIQAARRDYDAGLVEVCTGRIKDHFFLYAIPRKHRAPTRPYFSLAGNGIF